MTDLDALVTQPRHVIGDRGQRVERRGIARELREEDAGAFDGLHVSVP
jgi:hypothetical protein